MGAVGVNPRYIYLSLVPGEIQTEYDHYKVKILLFPMQKKDQPCFRGFHLVAGKYLPPRIHRATIIP